MTAPRLVDGLVRRLLIAAVKNATDVMDAVDPDDRSMGERREVDLVKDAIRAANGGDQFWRDLLYEAEPATFAAYARSDE